MKKLLILLTLCLLPFGMLFATYAEDAQEAARLMTKAEKLYKKHLYLEAMDSATLAYRICPQSVAARTFIYKHWDQTMRFATGLLEAHSIVEDLEHSRVRYNTYRLMVDINDNLQSSPLPIHGNYDRWVWMPEMQYWDGYLSDERKRLKRLEKEDAARKAVIDAEIELDPQ
jgi:hypothetical protein